MQFVIIARDGQDEAATQRRLDAREAHICHTDRYMQHMIMGVATLDEQETMNGSVMVVDFPTRADMDAWLAAEPYCTQGVWQDVTIIPCKVGPSFRK